MDGIASEGLLEIKKIFKVSAGAFLAGCSVSQGKIKKASEVRVLRKGQVLFQGRLDSLKRFKENNAETAGLHCALGFAGFQNFAVGDLVEVLASVSQAAGQSQAELPSASLSIKAETAATNVSAPAQAPVAMPLLARQMPVTPKPTSIKLEPPGQEPKDDQVDFESIWGKRRR